MIPRDNHRKFVHKAREVHGNKYTYPRSAYKNQHTKVPIVCRTHGNWFVTPDSHINGGTGCPMCALDARLGKGPKQRDAKKYGEEWARSYVDSSITDISRQFGFTPKLVADVLREHGVKLLSSKEINERKYRKQLPLVEGHLHVVQPEQWDKRGRRLYRCHGPSHFEALRVWRKPGQHTACNRSCARQRHTFPYVDKFLRDNGCTEVRLQPHSQHLRDSVVSYVCPHKNLVKRGWRSLVRAVIHGETICPHIDNFWGERLVREFVRRAVLPMYSVPVGPKMITTRGRSFSLDISILRGHTLVAIVEPGSHRKAVRYGGMSQRAASKSLRKIQWNDRRKRRWAAKRKIPILQLETGGKSSEFILGKVWDWLKSQRLTRNIRPTVSYGDTVREVPYADELRRASLLPGDKRWKAVCMRCNLKFRYYRQALNNPSDIHCPKCRGGVGKHGRTRKTIETRAEELGVKFELPSGESFNEDVHGESECVQCEKDTTPSVADLFRSGWSRKCKRCAMSRRKSEIRERSIGVR
jgi:hypothetical protein